MGRAEVLAVLGMLTMGTIKTLLNKLMYSIKARGIDGSTHSFEARTQHGRYLCAVCSVSNLPLRALKGPSWSSETEVPERDDATIAVHQFIFAFVAHDGLCTKALLLNVLSANCLFLTTEFHLRRAETLVHVP